LEPVVEDELAGAGSRLACGNDLQTGTQ
jgi:hypothetical protein